MMKIIYSHSESFSEYTKYVQRLIQEYSAHKICDIGGGANPVLSLEFINKNLVDCTVLDISNQELEKAPKEYKKLVQDIEAKRNVLPEQFDFIITKMMAEHVKNGKLLHKNVFTMLKPGGVSVHFFPTLYALPFVVNRLTPKWLSLLLLDVFSPRDYYQLGKFPAYYNWCYGPTRPMLAMLTEIGYEILEYRGFFGNTYYNRIPVIRNLHETYSRYLIRHPNPYLTSYAQIALRKPETASEITH